jgi:hypothetical protein
MHRCERSSFRSFLIAALFLTKNVAPQLGTGVGSDVATCSASFSSVAFLDVGFNGRSHGRSRARRLRRGFCSGSSYGLPCRSHGLFEGQNPVGGLVIDVVGDADWRLLVVAAFRVQDQRSAIQLANDSPFGLGGTVITSDAERGRDQSNGGEELLVEGWIAGTNIGQNGWFQIIAGRARISPTCASSSGRLTPIRAGSRRSARASSLVKDRGVAGPKPKVSQSASTLGPAQMKAFPI